MEVPVRRYCWCGSGKYYENCHRDFDIRLKAFRRQGFRVPGHDLIKTPEQIEGIRRSAKLNVEVLDYVASNIRAGISTEEIDRWVYEYTVSHGGIPAPLHYEGFPKSVCTSRNDVVCHGIPSSKELLLDGDILNVDVSTVLGGYFSDSSRMFCIGNVPQARRNLVDNALLCLKAGLSQIKPWAPIGNVGQAISDCARKFGYSVVREIGGHGIGLAFHEDPFVDHTAKAGTGMLMVPGMVFTIEPMINLGTRRFTIDRRNGWTIRTADGKASAQWEYQVLVTETGYEVLAW